MKSWWVGRALDRAYLEAQKTPPRLCFLIHLTTSLSHTDFTLITQRWVPKFQILYLLYLKSQGKKAVVFLLKSPRKKESLLAPAVSLMSHCSQLQNVPDQPNFTPTQEFQQKSINWEQKNQSPPHYVNCGMFSRIKVNNARWHVLHTQMFTVHQSLTTSTRIYALFPGFHSMYQEYAGGKNLRNTGLTYPLELY